VTVEPGGTVAIHNHKDRPAVAHLIQGTLTEKREGGFVREHHTGDTWTETKEVTHWAENHGDDKAVLVVADIFKP
ncbi:MAG: cupin domain-containing protein, partial [Burkholderiales bacterium]|nr:cupin domain-containing protein [Burkholderiales bacterium]